MLVGSNSKLIHGLILVNGLTIQHEGTWNEECFNEVGIFFLSSPNYLDEKYVKCIL